MVGIGVPVGPHPELRDTLTVRPSPDDDPIFFCPLRPVATVLDYPIP